MQESGEAAAAAVDDGAARVVAILDRYSMHQQAQILELAHARLGFVSRALALDCEPVAADRDDTDPELTALETAYRALEPLLGLERGRALAYLNDRLIDSPRRREDVRSGRARP